MTNLCEDHSWAGEGDCPKCERAFSGLVPAQAEPSDGKITINGEPATAHSLLAALIDIYDDAQNHAPEDRCYVEGAWSDVLGEARLFLLLSAPVAEPAQQGTKEPMEPRSLLLCLLNLLENDEANRGKGWAPWTTRIEETIATMDTPHSGQGKKAPTDGAVALTKTDLARLWRTTNGGNRWPGDVDSFVDALLPLLVAVRTDGAVTQREGVTGTSLKALVSAYGDACFWKGVEDDKPHLEKVLALQKQVVESIDALAARSGEGAVHHGLDSDDRVCFYEQDFYVLSNFSSFNLQWKGRTFPTSEHAYHWEKFLGMEKECPYPIATKILNEPSAHTAFKVAEVNRHQRRPDWDDVKIGIMREILRAKADQHEYVRRKLLATGDRELIENSWRDSYWGWGPKRDGKNMLGKLWMEVRAELRAAAPSTGSER